VKGLERALDFAERNGKDEMVRVRKIDLPHRLKKWIDRYNEVDGTRGDFLWKWTYGFLSKDNPNIMLSTVPKGKVEELAELKTMMVMLTAVVDDVADVEGNTDLVDKSEKAVLGGLSEEGGRIGFLSSIWDEIEDDLRELPRHGEFENLLHFDLRQMFNSARHSILVNSDPQLANKTESYVYGCHNMILLPQFDIDLMASEEFDRGDLGEFREVAWHAQRMARIGNWISTSEREAGQEDLSSAVFAMTSKEKVSNSGLNGEVKESLLEDWCDCYEEIEERRESIGSVDVDALLRGLEVGLGYHLASRGLK